ncbi:MAG: MBL fold metallo-hydrolase [Pseudomonadota bacterium]
MQITHLQSATQIIDLGGTRVLTDPWLTDGEYYGSWYHYPPFPPESLSGLDYDYIYVSHIHPDHLSEKTFKALPKKVPVLIHRYAAGFLKRKIEMLGFEVIECDHATPFAFASGGSLTIYAADNCNPELCAKFFGCAPMEKTFGSTQIDTLALFEHQGLRVLNTNDCPFALAETTIRAHGLDALEVDALLVGYGGAGPYPQCFTFENEAERDKAVRAKERQFLDLAVKYVDLLRPKSVIPFAGTYILGSRLAHLTPYRGVPSIEEALRYIADHAEHTAIGVLMEQLDRFDVGALEHTAHIREGGPSYDEYVREIEGAALAYDGDDWDDAELEALLTAAHGRFRRKAEEIGYRGATDIVVETGKIRFVMGLDAPPRLEGVDEALAGSAQYVKLTVDHNLFHRLLRGPRFAHWNNAEIGSHLQFERNPNVFERGLYHCLCFFHQ